jgi:aspartyl-tRNA(Asn)/glutamyl-tRNA(Gln) amidotransferase subunit C
MAKLSKDDILKLAKLSRLKLSDDEISHFQKDISKVLNYVEQLGSVDTTGLAPTYQVNGLDNAMREDELYDYQESSNDLLKNAPATQSNQIKVKRVMQ